MHILLLIPPIIWLFMILSNYIPCVYAWGLGWVVVVSSEQWVPEHEQQETNHPVQPERSSGLLVSAGRHLRVQPAESGQLLHLGLCTKVGRSLSLSLSRPVQPIFLPCMGITIYYFVLMFPC